MFSQRRAEVLTYTESTYMYTCVLQFNSYSIVPILKKNLATTTQWVPAKLSYVAIHMQTELIYRGKRTLRVQYHVTGYYLAISPISAGSSSPLTLCPYCREACSRVSGMRVQVMLPRLWPVFVTLTRACPSLSVTDRSDSPKDTVNAESFVRLYKLYALNICVHWPRLQYITHLDLQL